MSEHFTGVEIVFCPEFRNDWLRFGAPDARIRLDRRRTLVLFRPRRIFGYVRWQANEYGTHGWRFVVAQTRSPHERVSQIAGVRPGAEMHLSAVSATNIKRALSQIDALERAGFSANGVSPNYYRHVHSRIVTRQPIRPYTAEQHAAHVAAMAVPR